MGDITHAELLGKNVILIKITFISFIPVFLSQITSGFSLLQPLYSLCNSKKTKRASESQPPHKLNSYSRVHYKCRFFWFHADNSQLLWKFVCAHSPPPWGTITHCLTGLKRAFQQLTSAVILNTDIALSECWNYFILGMTSVLTTAL